MIIQHNMAAANANRALGNIVTAQGKSTEKLSSGYRINRAADDAAGLSISEKMRGQIRGLNQASSNAQDGISLIQTAEGGLSETHSILQRMRELSVQASNGTETDDDRKAVADEIKQLQSEITRISSDTEFNTMKLLDGSLADGTKVAGVSVDAKVSTAGLANNALVTTNATKGVYTSATAVNNSDSGMQIGDETKLTINYLDENDEQQSITVSLKYKDLTTLESADGSRTYTVASAAATTASKTTAFLAELKQTTLDDKFDITSGADKSLVFTAKEGGTDTFKILSTSESTVKAGVTAQVAAAATVVTTKAEDSYQSIATEIGAYDGAASSNIEDNIFSVNGQRFAYVTSAGETALKGMNEYADVNYVIAAAAAGPDNTEASSMAALISAKTGINAETNATTDTSVDLKPGASSYTAGGGMTLQIGANEKQTLTFGIKNMSAKALKVDENNVNLDTQENAQNATKIIDEAIKTVSTERGKMGAVQNRLEHTISNLDTSAENLQSAESRIRDVNMAKQMVEFAKNNILQQAAQSMLAQANQSTQGVLSLLG